MMKSLTSKSNKTKGEYDPSVDMPASMYCSFVESFKQTCFQNSILQFWNYNEKKIKQTTKQDILNKLDKYKNELVLFYNSTDTSRCQPTFVSSQEQFPGSISWKRL